MLLAVKSFYVSSAAQRVNQDVTTEFLVSAGSQRERKGGGSYLAMTLTDRTGSFEGRMWKPTPEVLAWFKADLYVCARGRVESYNGSYQLCVEDLQPVPGESVDVADFQRVSRYKEEVLWGKLTAYVDGFQNPHLQQLVRAFLDDPELSAALRRAPAAKTLHHAWIRGLLEHIVFLLRLCEIVAPHYRDEVDADLLMTAAILHDIGKVRELSWDRAFTYTTEGQLLGHITIGIGMVHEKIAQIPNFPRRLAVLVEHMMLSHHGRYEFGSPKLPMTPEAVVFSALDDLEAKMENMRAEFRKSTDAGRAADEPTDYSRSMERVLLSSKAYLAAGEGVADPVSAGESAPAAEGAPSLDSDPEQAPSLLASQPSEPEPESAPATAEGEPRLIFTSIVEL